MSLKPWFLGLQSVVEWFGKVFLMRKAEVQVVLEKGLYHTSILLHGESGIAKKMFMQALHCFAFPSLVRNRPFRLSSLRGDQRDTASKASWGDRNSPGPCCPGPSYGSCFPTWSFLSSCSRKRGWTLETFNIRNGTTLGCRSAMIPNCLIVFCVLQIIPLRSKRCSAMICRNLGEEYLDYVCRFLHFSSCSYLFFLYCKL